jgi:putative hemolysin
VTAAEATAVLREIGRLRELTFRAAGEGTGHATDLDDFDGTYTHLFAYDTEARRIAGAYRVGRTDAIVPRGISGLYTSTLFRFEPRFFGQLGPALELGRSFVRPEYQRSRTLLLLWRAIAAFVVRNPRYRRLFGPVSVSAEYTPFSRDLIVDVLGSQRFRHPLAELVQARAPAERRSFGDGGLGDPARLLHDPGDLSAVISSAEADSKGLPVLVTEYLKLGGRFLDFNVDALFSNVLDGLVVVDLPKTDPRVLKFYMGKGEAESYLAYAAGPDTAVA